MTILAGDIGGTKTTLALFDAADNVHEVIREQTFPSSEYAGLEAIVTEFLRDDSSIDVAAFGVAGPVVAGRAQITNLPWVIEEPKLAQSFDIQTVRLVNDLVATATAIPILQDDDFYVLQAGVPVAGTAIAVIAPGTGLGEAFLTFHNGRYVAHSSEGGHADFSPSNHFELALLNYLYEHYEHVSTERVCSGTGLPNIYKFLTQWQGTDVQDPSWVAEAIAAADDATPIIVNNALQRGEECPLCVQTLERFVAILGAEAGDLALTFMATGGLYLGGGMPPRILPALQTGTFMHAFCNKGRFATEMAHVPVRVILNPKAALLGAACVAFELADNQ